MGRYILAIVTICLPIQATIHAALYDTVKEALAPLLRNDLFRAGLAASLGMNLIGIGILCFLGWVVWRLHIQRIRRRILEAYSGDVALEPLMDWLHDELSREVTKHAELVAKKRPYKYDGWDNSTSICDTIKKVSNLFSDEKSVKGLQKLLKKHKTFAVVEELRIAVVAGFNRVRALLAGDYHGRTPQALHRAEEMVTDVRDRHLSRFAACLSSL